MTTFSRPVQNSFVCWSCRFQSGGEQDNLQRTVSPVSRAFSQPSSASPSALMRSSFFPTNTIFPFAHLVGRIIPQGKELQRLA